MGTRFHCEHHSDTGLRCVKVAYDPSSSLHYFLDPPQHCGGHLLRQVSAVHGQASQEVAGSNEESEAFPRLGLIQASGANRNRKHGAFSRIRHAHVVNDRGYL